MRTFSDDFNRADGPLGDNWVSVTGNVTILSQTAYPTGWGWSRVAASYDFGRMEAHVDFWKPSGLPLTCRLVLKDTSADGWEFWAHCYYYAGQYIFSIHKEGPGTSVELVSQDVGNGGSGFRPVSLTYEDGHLTATLDGSVVLEADDATTIAGWYVGIGAFSGDVHLDNFSLTSGNLQSIEVTPDPFWVGAGTQLMLVTGTATSWTAGIPGDTTITVDHGVVESQYVEDATHAGFYLTPDEYIGPVTVTESKYGAQDTVTAVAINPEPTPVAECLLSPDGAGMINSTASHTAGDLTTSDMVVGLGIGGAPNLTLVQAIADLWYAEFRMNINPPSGYAGDDLLSKLWLIINGGWDPAVGPWPEPSSSTLKQDTETASSRLVALTTTYTDLATLAADLGGSPTLYSHADLKLQLDAIQLAGNQDVLDMLSLMWGASTPTLTDIATLISDLATIAGYTLGDVLSAIAAQDVAGARADILAAISALRGDSSSTVAGVSSLLSDVAEAVQEIKVSLQELRTPSAYTIQDVLDAIAAIPPGGGGGSAGPPVWPGSAGVTLGAAVSLSTGLTIAAPMDGVIVTITGVAAKLNGHAYTYDDTLCYRNVGALAFFSDAGDVETYQALGFTSAIYTPRYLARAGGVKVMTPAGTVGTVQPWTVNP